MNTSPAICVVGSINMDLVFRTPRMPVVGETITGHEFVQIAGGKGANQAVAAARSGACTTLIACVGADAYGEQSLAGLKQDGIDTSQISIISDCATGVAGILVDDQGRNSIVIAPGANARLTPAHVLSKVIQQAQLLICQCETPIETIQTAMQLAQQHGVKVVFNPAPAIALSNDIFKLVDYLIVNETEAGQLSGSIVTDIASAQVAARLLLARGGHCVLLTMGEHGVCVATQTEFHHIAALKVQAVDSTAAGDTFVGAFATAIGNGLTPLDAATQAQYSAALAVTKLGAQSSIPHRADVEKFKESLL
jgi:ribokinase